MNNFVTWLCVLATWPAVHGLYHELSREIFEPPKNLPNDSYFGYSITYDSEYRRLVISSPREDKIGKVYDCDVESKKCTTVNVHIERESKNYTHEYWFGATVKAGPDFVVMCAPRYTRYKLYNKEVRYGTFGKCFKHSKGHLNEMKSINEKQRLADSPNPFEATMDSFGWSIDVAFDDSIIVGGPAMFVGRAMIYEPRKREPIFIRRNDLSPTLNFGYGVSTGTFINSDLSYAVSSTYGKQGFGSVLFFKGVGNQMELMKEVDTEVVGSMFGAVLCAAVLYGNRSDLLVGAPTYALKSTYNRGAVYVYKGNKELKRQSPRYIRTIVGQTDGAMFGSAIVNLGDLNGDKRDEVAIGAPFENGHGAVYIYSGAELASTKTEKTLTYLQKIEPEAHSTFGNSFGMSLTPLLDYDHNGCNELAIGAPFSDAVVLLRCIAAITVKTEVYFPSNLQNRTVTKTTDFALKVCLEVEEPRRFKEFKALVETSVEMDHTYAHLKTVSGPFKYQTLLHTGQLKYCKDVPFVLPSGGHYDTQINYQVKSKLLENPLYRQKFEAVRVIISDRSILQHQDSVWAAECVDQKGCVPQLSLIANFSFKYDDHQYIIGSSKTEYFEVILLNSGEVAYDPCADIRIVGARVFEPPAFCERDPSSDGDRLLCKPRIPLRTNGNFSTGNIVLEMTHLTNQDQNITVNVYLHDRCTDAKVDNFTFTAPLKTDPNSIVVKGITDIGDTVGMTTKEVESDGKNMQHVYEIVNRGPTNWKGLTVVVSLQKLSYVEYSEAPVTIHISSVRGDTYSDCLITSNGTEWMDFSCKIENFMVKRHDIKIVVPIFIVPGTLDQDTIMNNNVTITSKVTFYDGITTLPLSTHTTITTLTAVIVPVWVIIVAALVGLFILIIIAFILYECGFLRRKERQNLQQLQKSVRRQTIIRRSTTSTSQAAAEDRKQILEQVNEGNENVHTEVDNKAATPEN